MKWFGITLLTIGLGLLSIYLPWYIILTAFSLFCLIIISHVRFQWMVYIIIFLALQIGSKGPFIGFSTARSQTIEALPVYFIFTSIAILAFWVRKFAKIDIADSRKNPLYTPILLLVCYSILSIFWSPASVTENIDHVIFLILNISLFFYIFRIVDSEILHRRLMWCLIFSGIFLSLQAIFSPFLFLGSYPIKIYGDTYLEIGTSNIVASRALGFYMNTLLTSIVLGCLIMVAYGLLLNERNRARIILLGCAMSIFLFTIFLTQSRVGLWGLIIMVFLLLCLSYRLRKNFIRSALIICLCTFIIFMTSQIVTYKFFTKSGKETRVASVDLDVKESGTLGSRLYYWEKGFEALEKSSLTLVGLGAGGYKHFYPNIPTPHNLYLSLFFDFGIMAVIFVFCIMFTFVRRFREITKHQNTYLQKMSLVFGILLIGISIMSLTYMAYNFIFLWLIIGLAYSTFSLAQQELKEKKISQNHIGTS